METPDGPTQRAEFNPRGPTIECDEIPSKSLRSMVHTFPFNIMSF